MTARLLLLAALLGAEALAASLAWDGDTLPASLGLLRLAGPWLLRWTIGALALFATFAYLRAELVIPPTNPSIPLLLAHLLSTITCAVLGAQLYQPNAPAVLALPWVLSAAAALATALAALLPLGPILKNTGHLWWLSASASALACWAGAQSRQLWDPAARSTFALVRLLLQPLVPTLVSQPETLRLGTPRFTVIISPECSGLEGIGLLLIFSAFWLVLFRRELRFPQALVLVPAGILALYLLNAIRIAALVLIGDAGYRHIAAGGFHSQAGWIAFNLVALGLSLTARRWRWIAVHPSPQTVNPAAPFLLPFLGITAAGLVSTAFSAGFEWAYGLRVAVAAILLWHFRRDWLPLLSRPTLIAPLAGTAVLAVWLGADALLGPRLAPALHPHPVWIALRVIGASVTVPLAEELAFRGFLYRRLIDEEFEHVPWTQFQLPALVFSSLAFGLLHGRMWLPATLAGLIYAAAMLRRGSLTDAIAAHSLTNAGLSAYVLSTQRWDLW